MTSPECSIVDHPLGVLNHGACWGRNEIQVQVYSDLTLRGDLTDIRAGHFIGMRRDV